MGAYGEHSSRLRNFEGFKLVTNLKETKEAKCKCLYGLKLEISTQTMIETADILFPIYDLLHIQIFYW